MNRTRLIAISALLIFLLEAALIAYVDRPLSEYLRTVDTQHPALINVFRAYTDLGKSKWYLWPSGIGIILCATLIRIRTLRQDLQERLVLLSKR